MSMLVTPRTTPTNNEVLMLAQESLIEVSELLSQEVNVPHSAIVIQRILGTPTQSAIKWMVLLLALYIATGVGISTRFNDPIRCSSPYRNLLINPLEGDIVRVNLDWLTTEVVI